MSSEPSPGDIYDWECTHVHARTDQDLAFYRDLLRPGGSLLELGCGTGRLTRPLADKAATTVGIDIDPNMLAVAQRRAPGALLVCADMRDFALARRFDLVAIPYNTLQLLDPNGQAACLGSAAAHLDADGTLALEVTDFAGGAGADVPEPLRISAGVLDGYHVEVTGRLTTEPDRIVYHRRVELSRGRDAVGAEQDIVLHTIGPDRIRELLCDAGLEPTAVEMVGSSARWVAQLACRS